MPSRPMPQSDEMISRSGGMCLQRLADQRGDVIGSLDLQGMVVDHADHDLLVLDHLADRLEVAGAG